MDCVCSTLEPVVGGAFFLMLERQEVAGTVVQSCAGELSFDAKASPAKGRFQQPWGIHSLGHFLSSERSANRDTNDR